MADIPKMKRNAHIFIDYFICEIQKLKETNKVN